MSPASFQSRMCQWVLSCFGPKLLMGKKERAHRLLEEAIELAQASGLSKDEALLTMDYVYERPPGEVIQEVGGVYTCLSALCSAHDIDMVDAAEAELERIEGLQEQIRVKNLTKPRSENRPASGDLQQLYQQIREFVGQRPVRLLTRKANSKADSGVAYETVFPKAPQDGTLQVFVRADEGEAVAAVNVSTINPLLVDRSNHNEEHLVLHVGKVRTFRGNDVYVPPTRYFQPGELSSPEGNS